MSLSNKRLRPIIFLQTEETPKHGLPPGGGSAKRWGRTRYDIFRKMTFYRTERNALSFRHGQAVPPPSRREAIRPSAPLKMTARGGAWCVCAFGVVAAKLIPTAFETGRSRKHVLTVVCECYIIYKAAFVHGGGRQTLQALQTATLLFCGVGLLLRR